jgi:NTE family protein
MNQLDTNGRSAAAQGRLHQLRPLESASATRALVLGGGGLAGIAWEIGVLRGAADVVPALASTLCAADLIIGTSAGSVVAAQLTSYSDLDALYADQLTATTSEIEVDFDVHAQRAHLAAATAGATSPQHARQRLGAFAITARVVDPDTRRAAIAARLPGHTWPDQHLIVTAVDAETGEFRAFTRESGVDLIDAVAASCAVPGVWPPPTIAGRRFIDGATRSSTNADLAVGYDRILIVAPSTEATPWLSPGIADEIDLLKPAAVLVIDPDDASLKAFGRNPLSPATRIPAALAGRDLGQRHAKAIAAFWQ